MRVCKKVFMFGILSLCLIGSAFAQSGASGGGREKELALRQMMLDLIPYLESDQGQKDFPEIVDYNRNHLERFSLLINSTAIMLTEGSVRDGFDVDRDCVSYFGDVSNRRIVCNASAIPNPAVLAYQPALYAFLFHEVLVQTQIEKPRSAEIPSDYSISARMKFHKETFEKMMPGTSQVATTKWVLKEFTEEETKTACDGSLCKLMSIGLNSVAGVNTMTIDRATYETVQFYLQALKNQPQYYASGQTMLMFYSDLIAKSGINFGSNTSISPSKNSLASVVTSAVDNTTSLYVDRSIYNAITIYMTNMVNHKTAEPQEYPQFTPAEQTILMFYLTLTEKFKAGTIKATPVTQELHDFVATYMRGVVNDNPNADEDSHGLTYPQFTPAEQSVIMLITNLL